MEYFKRSLNFILMCSRFNDLIHQLGLEYTLVNCILGAYLVVYLAIILTAPFWYLL